MNIQELQQKIKYYMGEYITDEIYIVAVIVLVGLSAFGLGRLSFIEEQKIPVSIEYAKTAPANVLNSTRDFENQTEIAAGGLLVASKNGSKYHFPWCSGAQRMKEENKIWFESKEEAQSAGYEPAKNCKGL